MLTCAHVVNRALGRDADDERWPPSAVVQICFPLGDRSGAAELTRASVIHFEYREPSIDVAVLRPAAARPAVRVSLGTTWSLEDRFAAFGFPARESEGLWAHGTISGRTGKGVQLNTDAGSFLEPGFSGAPVWNQDRQAVVGIVVRATGDNRGAASNIGVMLPLHEVAETWPALTQWLPSAREPPARPGNQLPWADIDSFTGRAAELDEVCRRLTADPARRRITAIAGMGGVGKTAFAVHVAYRVKEHFDTLAGIDLRGMDPAGPLPGHVAMERLLGDLIPPSHVPADRVELERQYRTQLSNRRALLILDNAADAPQVHALLLPSEACAVLITSRRGLPSLDGVVPCPLDVLSDDEGLALLGRLVSGDRVESDADAAPALVRLCGGLPLALRLAAATLNHYRLRPLSSLTDDLREHPGRILELSGDDGGPPLAATFAASFASCRPEEREAFALLGLLTQPEFGALDVAQIAGIDVRGAARRLDALVRAQLLEEAAADTANEPQYRFHDILRMYARHQLTTVIGPQRRRAAEERLVSARLMTVETAEAAGSPEPTEIDLPESVPLDAE